MWRVVFGITLLADYIRRYSFHNVHIFNSLPGLAVERLLVPNFRDCNITPVPG